MKTAILYLATTIAGALAAEGLPDSPFHIAHVSTYASGCSALYVYTRTFPYQNVSLPEHSFIHSGPIQFERDFLDMFPIRTT